MIPGSGRSPWEGNGNPLWYSYLENSMNRGVWRVTGRRVTKNCIFSEAITEFIKKITWSSCRDLFFNPVIKLNPNSIHFNPFFLLFFSCYLNTYMCFYFSLFNFHFTLLFLVVPFLNLINISHFLISFLDLGNFVLLALQSQTENLKERP